MRRDASISGSGGQRLGTYKLDGTPPTIYFTALTRNVWFGGKLIRTGAVGSQASVVTDRLGSVRVRKVGSTVTRLDFWPYGEEKPSATGQDNEKFATYTRDASGLDYADQRYYGSQQGRFGTPDPYEPNNPELMADPVGDWNRYAYTASDPVNRIDRQGLAYEFCGGQYDNCSSGMWFELTGILAHEEPYFCKELIWTHGVAAAQWSSICGSLMQPGMGMAAYALAVQAFQANEGARKREYDNCIRDGGIAINKRRKEAEEDARAEAAFDMLEIAAAASLGAAEAAGEFVRTRNVFRLAAKLAAVAGTVTTLTAIVNSKLGAALDRARARALEDFAGLGAKCQEDVDRKLPPLPKP